MTNLRVPLKRSDGREQWQNPCNTKRLFFSASSYKTALLAVILGQIRSHHSPIALVKRSRRTQSREVISF